MGEDAGEHRVRFRILGSFECWDGTERVRVGGPVHEKVLVTLLLEPQRVLPVFRLVEAVWDENADPFTGVVRMTIMGLRRKLGQPALIETITGVGYRIP